MLLIDSNEDILSVLCLHVERRIPFLLSGKGLFNPDRSLNQLLNGVATLDSLALLLAVGEEALSGVKDEPPLNLA